MSFDRQIDQLCPHIVVEELLTIGSDQRTIRPKKPISTFDSVEVSLNRAMVVPSEGVHTPAHTFGTREEPFNIKAGVNDTLVVDVAGFTTQTVTIPATSQITGKHLADLLNQALKGVIFSVVEGRNTLEFRTAAIGPAVTAMFRTGSTLAEYLGMKVNRQWRGRQTAPGWTLINDPLTLPDRPARLIIFDDTLKTFNPVVEVNYSTVRQECRRCGGTGVENDWRYGTNGSVAEVRDEALLIQEIEKMVYTIRGSNPFHTWYGTSILEQIGSKLTADGFVQNVISSDLTTAFNRWQIIKKQQEENVGQIVSDAEFPYQLLGVQVEQSRKDPTVVFVSMTIQNRTLGRPIDLTRGLKLPQPTDLLGSTAAQGIIRQSLQNFVLTG